MSKVNAMTGPPADRPLQTIAAVDPLARIPKKAGELRGRVEIVNPLQRHKINPANGHFEMRRMDA
jgi:hypothetical protein